MAAIQITDPVTSNIVYVLEVLSRDEWYLYSAISSENPDYANAVTKLGDVPIKFRSTVKLEIGRLAANIEASKSG